MQDAFFAHAEMTGKRRCVRQKMQDFAQIDFMKIRNQTVKKERVFAGKLV